MKINCSKKRSLVFHPSRYKMMEPDFPVSFRGGSLKILRNSNTSACGWMKLQTFKSIMKLCVKYDVKNVYDTPLQTVYLDAWWSNNFCSSLILSVLHYCLPIWDNLPTTKTNRIKRIWYRTAKLVVNPKTYSNVDKIDALEQLRWLLCHERVEVYPINFGFM